MSWKNSVRGRGGCRNSTIASSILQLWIQQGKTEKTKSLKQERIKPIRDPASKPVVLKHHCPDKIPVWFSSSCARCFKNHLVTTILHHFSAETNWSNGGLLFIFKVKMMATITQWRQFLILLVLTLQGRYCRHGTLLLCVGVYIWLRFGVIEIGGEKVELKKASHTQRIKLIKFWEGEF